jgi:hypothetical protein
LLWILRTLLYVADIPNFYRASGALRERGPWLAEALGQDAEKCCVRNGFSCNRNGLAQEAAAAGRADRLALNEGGRALNEGDCP